MTVLGTFTSLSLYNIQFHFQQSLVQIHDPTHSVACKQRCLSRPTGPTFVTVIAIEINFELSFFITGLVSFYNDLNIANQTAL